MPIRTRDALLINGLMELPFGLLTLAIPANPIGILMFGDYVYSKPLFFWGCFAFAAGIASLLHFYRIITASKRRISGNLTGTDIAQLEGRGVLSLMLAYQVLLIVVSLGEVVSPPSLKIHGKYINTTSDPLAFARPIAPLAAIFMHAFGSIVTYMGWYDSSIPVVGG